MPSFDRNTVGQEVVAAFSAQIKDKTILITGPSAGGIGAETALALAHGSPAQILLLGRTESKIAPVIEKIATINPAITVRFITLDLASQESVRKTASTILADSSIEKIDVLINNAGVMALADFETTKEGIELQFGANHIGHFLLTNLLMPKILAAGEGARIVNVSSTGHELGSVLFDDYNFQDGKVYDAWKAYAQSKSANALFAASLASKLSSRGVLSFSLQPGFVLESNLAGHLTPELWASGAALAQDAAGVTEFEAPKTLQEGCSTTLVAAFDPSVAAQSGGFLQDCVVRPIKFDHAKGKENEDRLWALSEKLVGERFEL